MRDEFVAAMAKGCAAAILAAKVKTGMRYE
jgi:hypothetical protein